MNERPSVVLLPGGIMPADLAYAPLIPHLQDRYQPHAIDLEVYATDAPPPAYSLDLEVEALRRRVDVLKLDTFHLFGYSGGGAVSIAFAGRYPARIRSLSLFEPARIPGKAEPEEAAQWERVRATGDLPPQQMMETFVRVQLKPGVQPAPQPPGPLPAWMAKRPAGIKAMLHAFWAYSFDRQQLRQWRFPVYLGLGDLTHELEEHKAQVLARVIADLWIEVHHGVHHFDPPHRVQPARFARSLRSLWERAEPCDRDAAPGSV